MKIILILVSIIAGVFTLGSSVVRKGGDSSTSLNSFIQKLDESSCMFPFCSEKNFTIDAYITGVSDYHGKLIDHNGKETSSFTNQLMFAYDCIKGNKIWNCTDGSFLQEEAFIGNIKTLDLRYKGEVVDDDQFLKKSFGAKARISGIYERKSYGLDSISRIKLRGVDIVSTMEDWLICSDCVKYSNNYFEFSYHPDWVILEEIDKKVVLSKSKENLTKEEERDSHGSENQFTITISIGEGEKVLNKKIYKEQLFWNDYAFSYTKGNNRTGNRFALQKGEEMILGNIHYLYQDDPFFFSPDTLMPYVIFLTLKTK